MRRFLAAVSLLVLPSLLLASPAQHGASAAAAVPSAVAHAAPMPAAGTMRSSAPRPYIAGRTGSRPTSSARMSARSLNNGRPISSAPPLRPAWQPGFPPSSIAPIPSSLAYTNTVPFLFPGSSSYGHGGHGRDHHFRDGGVILPWGDFGGFYVPLEYNDSYADQGAPPAGENAAIDNGPASPDQYPNPYDDPRNQQLAAEQPTAPPAYYPPSEPVYDFVFVKRDGTKVFAVAYSITKDKIQYVTKEGLRRTLPLENLDFDATEKSNEERGNTVNLPTPPPSLPS